MAKCNYCKQQVDEVHIDSRLKDSWYGAMACSDCIERLNEVI